MSITIDSKNRVHLYLRYTDRAGVKHHKHFTNKDWKIKRDAKQFQDEFLSSVGVGNDRMTVNDLYGHYIKERQMKLKSKYNIESCHRLYIRDNIGKMRITEITQATIKKWQKELTTHGLSNRYIGKIQDLLRTIFLFGVRYEYIDRNPFKIENVQVAEEKHVVEHWTPQEFETFIAHADNPDFADFFTLLYWTGLRYGEAVALTVADYDPTHGTLSVSKTWDNVHKVATSPKTKNSYRTVVCTEKVKTLVLERIRLYQGAYGYDTDAILFGYTTHLSPRTMQHAFERYIKASGVKRINIHALRHSHVFMLRESGFDAFDIAKRLGHTVEMVNEYYGQYFLDRQKNMIEKMEEIQENGTQLAHKPVMS